MKSNPLLLGNKKLHAATNLVFDEGVIRTRPGITYRCLGARGEFQGACEYRPAQGISSGSFADAVEGIALVVDGDLWFNGRRVAAPFKDKGDVHIYQAENYLILQNPQSTTCWWDGARLTYSPGLNETDWNDPETPQTELALDRPVADIPECDVLNRESGIRARLTVIDSVTEQAIPGVYGVLTHNGVKAFELVTDAVGTAEFYPTPRVYQYSLTKPGYEPLTDLSLVVNGEATEVIYDVCRPPAIVVAGFVDVAVRLTPLPPQPCLDVSVTLITASQASLSIENTSDTTKQVTGLVCEEEIETSPTLPLTVLAGDTAVLTVSSLESLAGKPFTLETDCAVGLEELEFPEDRVHSFTFMALSGIDGSFGDGSGAALRPIMSVVVDGDSATLVQQGEWDGEVAQFTQYYAQRGHTFSVSVPPFADFESITSRTLTGTIFNSGPGDMHVVYFDEVFIVPAGQNYTLPSLNEFRDLMSEGSPFVGASYSVTVL